MIAPVLIVFTDLALLSADAQLERLDELFALARPACVLAVVRDKQRSARERLDLGRRLARLARDRGQYLGMADRLDLAQLLEADAVHLGEGSVNSADARRLLGETLFVSRACHDPERAGAMDADAVLLSPILAARKGREPLGVAALARARSLVAGQRLYALGGIDAENAGACLAAGADGAAAIGAVLAQEPGPLLRALGIARA